MWIDLIIFLHSMLSIWVAIVILTSNTRYFFHFLVGNGVLFFAGLYFIDTCVTYFWDAEHQGFVEMGFIFYQVCAQTLLSFCLALWLNAKPSNSIQ